MTHHQKITKTASALCAGAAFVSALLATPAFAEKETMSLARQHQWIANYDEDSCHLISAFGTGADQLVLRITRYQPGDEFTLTFYGQGLKTGEVESNVKLSFVSPAVMREHQTMNGTSGKTSMVILPGISDLLDRTFVKNGVGLPPILPEQEASVTALTFQFDRKAPVRLELGSMAIPMQAMRTCTTDLVKSWGLDPDVQAKLSRHVMPKGSPGNWITTKDYPFEQLREGRNGLVRFRLDVDETGHVAGCHIQLKMKSADFNKLSCELISKRAQFDPALDAKGNPVKSYFVNTVRWTIAPW